MRATTLRPGMSRYSTSVKPDVSKSYRMEAMSSQGIDDRIVRPYSIPGSTNEFRQALLEIDGQFVGIPQQLRLHQARVGHPHACARGCDNARDNEIDRWRVLGEESLDVRKDAFTSSKIPRSNLLQHQSVDGGFPVPLRAGLSRIPQVEVTATEPEIQLVGRIGRDALEAEEHGVVPASVESLEQRTRLQRCHVDHHAEVP